MRHFAETLRPAWLAAGSYALANLAFDGALNLAIGATWVGAYLVWLAGLAAAAALSAGALAALLGAGPAIAVAGLVAVEQGLGGRPSVAAELAAAAGWAATVVWVGRRWPGGPPPVGFGLTVAAATGLGQAIAPRALQVFGAPTTPAWREVGAWCVFAGVLLVGALAARLRRRARRIPAEWLLAPLLAGIALLAVGAVHSGTRSDLRREPAAPRAGGADGPSVIVLVLDTVGASHLPFYGYERDTAPELARFVAECQGCALYPLALAPGSWTVPSHASLLTGLLPSEHGAHLGRFAPSHDVVASGTLEADETLAERLRASGYRTAAILANPYLRRIRGLERGFDLWFEPPAPRPLGLLAERLRQALVPDSGLDAVGVTPRAGRVNRELLAFLESSRGTPAFVLANYMDAHTPYAPPADQRGRFARPDAPPRVGFLWADADADAVTHARDRYDEAIRGLDREIGALLRALESRGWLDDAWLFVTSDHGEAFGAHGVVSHGTAVYGDQVWIPLLVRPPHGVALEPAAHAVGLLDVASTIAAVGSGRRLGHGRDLRVAGRPAPVPVEFFGRQPPLADRLGGLAGEPARAVVLGDLKLIEHAGRRELYRLGDDPDETRDLAARERSAQRSLVPLLPPLEPGEASPAAEAVPLSPEDEAALRALGYLE